MQRCEAFNWLLLGVGPQADFDFRVKLIQLLEAKSVFFFFSWCAYYFIPLVPKEI